MNSLRPIVLISFVVSACGSDTSDAIDASTSDTTTDTSPSEVDGSADSGDDSSDVAGDVADTPSDTPSDIPADPGADSETSSSPESTLIGVRTAPTGTQAIELLFYEDAWSDRSKGLTDRRVLRGRTELTPGGAVATLDGWWDPTDGTFSFGYSVAGGAATTCTGTVVDSVATGSCSGDFPNSSHFTAAGIDLDDVRSYCGTWSDQFSVSGGLGIITTGSVAAVAFGVAGSVSASIGTLTGNTITIESSALDATGTIAGTTASGTWTGLGLNGTWSATADTCPVLPGTVDPDPDADASDTETDGDTSVGEKVPSALERCDGMTADTSGIQNDLFVSGSVACTSASDGDLKCWGWQEASWMWLDSPTPTFNVYSTPRVMLNDGAPIPDVKQILSGYYLFCWVTNAGEGWCFGNDPNGERGRGEATTDFIPTPTRVTVLDALAEDGSAHIEGLYGGAGTTCGIFDGGRFACWGNNSGGLLGGTPFTVQRSLTAVEFFEGQNVVDAAGGMCALLDDGTVWCWGQNINGIIANPSAPPAADYAIEPTQIYLDATTPLTDVINIEPTNLGMCAHRRDTSIVCWGGTGILANFGYPAGISSRPDEYATIVPGTDGVGLLCGADHFAGNGYPCAIIDGTVWCWGVDNRQGIQGTGAFFTGPDAEPSLMTGAVEVEPFAGATCAQNSRGEFYCWGLDEYQIPDGANALFLERPTQVTF